MPDRVVDIALVVLGIIVMLLLVLLAATSCRVVAGDDITPTFAPATATPTSSAGFPVTLQPATSTPTPGAGEGTFVPTLPAPGGQLPTEPGTTPTAPGGGQIPGEATPTTEAPGTGGSGLVPGQTVSHQVVKGEWLLQIARCYGVSYVSIRNANHLPYPDLIYPGQVLTIPAIGSIGPVTGPPCVVAYTVQPGDTWDSLAARFGTSAAILQRANPGGLAVGAQIWVPRNP